MVIICEIVVGFILGVVLAVLGLLGFWAIVLLFALIGIMLCVLFSLMIAGVAIMFGIMMVRDPPSVKAAYDDYSRRVKEGMANGKNPGVE